MTKIPPGLLIALVVQVLCIGFVLIAPIGFDHPSEWGLDFGHFLFVALTYVLAWVGGIIAAALAKAWNLLAVQLALPALGILVVFAG